jgi:S-adenosylmethionine:tRNA ribosyltransferase-isomerase
VRVSDLHYELPSSLIARYPAAQRDGARMLEVGARELIHRHVSELPDLLPEGALVVVNDTRVLNARLLGKKAMTGGAAEVLLVRKIAGTRWWAMLRTSRRAREGVVIELDGASDGLCATVLAGANDEGLVEISLDFGPTRPPPTEAAVDRIVERVGHVPLPPYLERSDEVLDRERYQTRFARRAGAVAAPTAGLHFSDAMIERVRARCELASITLHVGPGTFRPVKADDLDDHPMHAEAVRVDDTLVAQVTAAKQRGAPVVAVGTTVVRALESAALSGELLPLAGETSLLIQPGFRFRVVDSLLTNFHLPESTLLALVFAFGGTHAVRRAYAAAIEAGYRFYSYGDAMWLPRRAAGGNE